MDKLKAWLEHIKIEPNTPLLYVVAESILKKTDKVAVLDTLTIANFDMSELVITLKWGTTTVYLYSNLGNSRMIDGTKVIFNFTIQQLIDHLKGKK